MFIGETAATKALKTTFQQMFGRQSADRPVGRSNPHDPERRVNVAQVDGGQVAPTEQLHGIWCGLPGDNTVSCPSFKQSWQVTAKLVLLDIDRPWPIGAHVSGYPFENSPPVDERRFNVQCDSRSFGHIYRTNWID